MPAICKTCEAPEPIRNLIERMRTADISYRDCALTVKTIRQYDISHAAIQRHEVEGHFDPQHVLASAAPLINPEDVTVGSVAKHKLILYWTHHKDDVPTDSEARAWMKVLSDFADADAAQTEAKILKGMFIRRVPQAIAIGEPNDN